MINSGVIEKAIAAHAGWKARLRSAIGTGKFDVAVGTVKLDNQCEFGKWLYGQELSHSEKETEQYHTVRHLHAQFHQEAARVVELATTGQKDAAEKAMAMDSSYAKTSTALTQAMTNWRTSFR